MNVPDDIQILILNRNEAEFTEAQAQRLSAWITASPDHARAFYREFAEERALAIALGGLQVKAGHIADTDGDSVGGSLLDALADMEANTPVQGLVDITARIESENEPVVLRIQPAATPSGPRVIVIPRLAVTAALAAMVLLGIWAAYSIFDRPDPIPAQNPPLAIEPEAPAEVLAHLRSSVDAVVRTAAGGPVEGPMIGGEYWVDGGLVGIEMASGAQLVIEGPARLVLQGPNATRLDLGKLVATVPPAAWGFTVNTPTARVVDYGTVFGVHADDLIGTEVHVFEGEVRAAVRKTDGTVVDAVPLFAHQAAQVDTTRSLIQQIDFAAGHFEQSVVKRISLIDLLANDRHTAGGQPFGLNPATGYYVSSVQGSDQSIVKYSAGAARSVPGNRFVERVFIPDGSLPMVGLPDGLDLADLPQTAGTTFGVIWCNGPMPSLDEQQYASIPNHLPDGQPGFEVQQTMIMHANTGIILDLDAIRAAYPGMSVGRVQMALANTSKSVPVGDAQDSRSDYTIYIGDDVALHHVFQRSDAIDQKVAHVDLELPADARFLTLLSTDGGDNNHNDWLVVGDPVFELYPDPD